MDQFSTLINALPAEQKSYQHRPSTALTCSFGIPSSAEEAGRPLTSLAAGCTGFEFILGERGLPLVTAFAASDFPAQTERLAVGYCSYNPQYDQCDLRPLINALSQTEFPKLKQLYLGDYFLYVNGPGATGWLGDVTPILNHSPALQYLSLVGNFSLTTNLSLPELTELSVELDDYQSSLNRGPISDETLTYLLSSHFSKLEQVFLDLSIDANVDTYYSLPDIFLQGSRMPALHKLEITGQYKAGELDKLAASPLCQRDGFKLIFEDD